MGVRKRCRKVESHFDILGLLDKSLAIDIVESKSKALAQDWTDKTMKEISSLTVVAYPVKLTPDGMMSFKLYDDSRHEWKLV